MENEQLDNVMDYSGGAQFQNDDDLELALGFVREQNEFMQVQGRTETESYIQNGEESRTVQEASRNEPQPGPSHRLDMNTIVQEGSWDEPQPGPSHRPDTPPSIRGINYAILQKTKRTYAKSAATDTSYEVKVDEQHHGQRLNDIRQELHNILDQARGDLAGNDLGRVVIQHNALNNPIVGTL